MAYTTLQLFMIKEAGASDTSVIANGIAVPIMAVCFYLIFWEKPTHTFADKWLVKQDWIGFGDADFSLTNCSWY